MRLHYTKLLQITQKFSDILAVEMPALREDPTGNDEEELAQEPTENTTDEAVEAQNEPPFKKLKVEPTPSAEEKAFSMLEYLLDSEKNPLPVGYLTATSEIILKAPTETLRVRNRNIRFFNFLKCQSLNQFFLF